jgi:YVTN family beta-propeller protein
MVGDVLCPVVVRAPGGKARVVAVAAGSLDVGGGVWVEVPGGLRGADDSGRRRRRSGGRRLWRARWAAIGAAVAVVAGTGGVAFSGATNAQVTPSQTLITPCRIMDTRSGPDNVGPRSTPLAGGVPYSIQVTGSNGNCTIPSGTSGVVMNVTIVGPGSNGFLTVFPGGATRPTASNLNYVAGQAPTPNQVTVALGATGQVSFFASGGPVNVIADVAGYTTAARLTNPQLAQNRWDQDLAKPATIPVGNGPEGVAFDGTNIWVTNFGSDNVTRINPATGAVVATIAVGDGPVGVAFDGTNIWVTNEGSGNVTRINAATGAVVATIAVGDAPVGVAFDGTNIWVANQISNNVTRINPATGAVATIAVGTNPVGVAFDGTNIWVTNQSSNNVTRINAATGAVGAPIPVGTNPRGVAFDGTNIWVANLSSDTVTRINPATGTVVGAPIAVGDAPNGVAFDGTNIWVTNFSSNNVTRINAATGTVVGAPITVGTFPGGVAFDGTNIWVTNAVSNNVTKLRAG